VSLAFSIHSYRIKSVSGLYPDFSFFIFLPLGITPTMLCALARLDSNEGIYLVKKSAQDSILSETFSVCSKEES
jgi:hypothetical protein